LGGHGSGFGPFLQVKIVRKTFISIVFGLLYAFLSLKNDVNVPSKSNKQKKLDFYFLVGILKVTAEKSRIRIRIRTKMTWIRNTAKIKD
jgi:hypothetical protein